jgi:PAS domain-containing protein
MSHVDRRAHPGSGSGSGAGAGSGSGSRDALRGAIERFKSAAHDLYAKRGKDLLAERSEEIERDLQRAQLVLRSALDAYRSGAALLSADGVIIVANDAFERRGFGRAGETPAAPLDDITAEPPRSEPRSVTVSMETSSGRRTLVARVSRVGDRDGTILLLLEEPTVGGKGGRS